MKRLKLSGNMIVIPINRQTGECEVDVDAQAERTRLKEEAAAAIELDVTLPNFLAGGCLDEQPARRHAYEEAMAEHILRESAEQDPQPQRPRHRREDL